MDILIRNGSLCLLKSKGVYYITKRKKRKHDSRRRKILRGSVKYISKYESSLLCQALKQYNYELQSNSRRNNIR